MAASARSAIAEAVAAAARLRGMGALCFLAGLGAIQDAKMRGTNTKHAEGTDRERAKADAYKTK